MAATTTSMAEGERPFHGHEAGEPPHGGAPDALGLPGERGQGASIGPGQDEDDREERELHEEQVSVGRAEESRHLAHEDVGVGQPRCDQHDHGSQRPGGEAPCRQDRVGTGVGSVGRARASEEKGEGPEPSDPDAGRQDVDRVVDDGSRGVGLHRGGMAAEPHERRGEGGEQRGLQARGQPVGPRSDIGAQREEREEEHEQPLAHEPDAPPLGVEDDAAQDLQIEGGGGPRFEKRGLASERGASRDDGDEGEDPRPDQDAPEPRPGGGAIRAAGEQEDRGAAHQGQARGQVHPARGESERGHRRSIIRDASRDILGAWPPRPRDRSAPCSSMPGTPSSG